MSGLVLRAVLGALTSPAPLPTPTLCPRITQGQLALLWSEAHACADDFLLHQALILRLTSIELPMLHPRGIALLPQGEVDLRQGSCNVTR